MHRDFEGTYGWGGNGSRHLAWELSPAPKGEYPPSVYARHIDEAIKRGDKLFGEPHTYLVAFDPDFEQFIANVAEGLRTYITYRSDGGRYARGLVRDSEEIREIHRRFLRSSVPRGTKVRLQATLWRRKSQIPSGRWALAVHFAADILTFPPDRVEASPAVVEQSRRNHAERVIRIAQSVVKNIDRQNHNQGDRLIKVVQIAMRLGYPRFLDLWYYAPDHVRVYMSMRTNNAFLAEDDGGHRRQVSVRRLDHAVIPDRVAGISVRENLQTVPGAGRYYLPRNHQQWPTRGGQSHLRHDQIRQSSGGPRIGRRIRAGPLGRTVHGTFGELAGLAGQPAFCVQADDGGQNSRHLGDLLDLELRLWRLQSRRKAWRIPTCPMRISGSLCCWLRCSAVGVAPFTPTDAADILPCSALMPLADQPRSSALGKLDTPTTRRTDPFSCSKFATRPIA